MNRDYYTVHEMTEWGPDEYSYLHFSETFQCYSITCVQIGGRNWVEGGWPIPSLEQAHERIKKWREGREFRNIPIAILHHVSTCEIIEEIPATGKRSCPR